MAVDVSGPPDGSIPDCRQLGRVRHGEILSDLRAPNSAVELEHALYRGFAGGITPVSPRPRRAASAGPWSWPAFRPARVASRSVHAAA